MNSPISSLHSNTQGQGHIQAHGGRVNRDMKPSEKQGSYPHKEQKPPIGFPSVCVVVYLKKAQNQLPMMYATVLIRANLSSPTTYPGLFNITTRPCFAWQAVEILDSTN